MPQLRARLLPAIIPMLSLAAAVSMVFALGSSSPGPGGPPFANTSPTMRTSADSVATGRALFIQSCAHCHGDDARGSGEDSDGPDLHGLRISNARIATVVHHGIQGEMPSFSKKLSPADTAVLIEYLRSLH
jgi:mono/diheme cytochrome c family protein